MRCEASGASFAIFWGEHQGALVVVANYIAPHQRAADLAQGHVMSYAEASHNWVLDAQGSNPVANALRSNWQWRLAGMRKISEGIRQADARATLARDETKLSQARGRGVARVTQERRPFRASSGGASPLEDASGAVAGRVGDDRGEGEGGAGGKGAGGKGSKAFFKSKLPKSDFLKRMMPALMGGARGGDGRARTDMAAS